MTVGMPGARHLRGIMQRPGRQAMRRAGGFANSLVAEFDQRGMEGMGSIFQMRDHSTVHFSSRGESLAGFPRFAIHLASTCGVEIALIERGLAAADYRGDDAGKCFDAAHGADGVGMFAGDGANLEREFCGGGERIAADAHRRRAGVRFLAVKRDRVALDSFCSEHHSERQAQPSRTGPCSMCNSR